MSTLGPLTATRVTAPSIATASVIFLHGLGDSGDGWSFLPPEVYGRKSLKHINFVLPNAPQRPITAFGGQVAPAWFDVLAFDKMAKADKEGIFQALGSVKELIEQEVSKGIPYDRIVLGGFSQGAALTQGSAVTLDKKIAGFVSVSGFMPVPSLLEPSKSDVNAETPILMLHGKEDDIVPFKLGERSRDLLKGEIFGMKNVEFNAFSPLAHSIGPEGLDKLLDFLAKTLPPQ